MFLVESSVNVDQFDEKVAVITGAANGIGLALAERCAHERMRIVLADIDEHALHRTARALQAEGATVLPVVTDVARATDVAQLAQLAQRTFGGVHLLCNNAGVGGSRWVWNSPLADWQRIIGVNLWGVIHGIKAFVPLMLDQHEDCHIVNTASIAGLIAYSGTSIYDMTKHAVVALSESLYLELEQIDANVHVSVLCPALVQTQLSAAGREDLGALATLPPREAAGPKETARWQRFAQRLSAEGVAPELVADRTFQAIRQHQFYIFTHDQYHELIQRRVDDMLHGRNPTNPLDLIGGAGISNRVATSESFPSTQEE